LAHPLLSSCFRSHRSREHSSSLLSNRQMWQSRTYKSDTSSCFQT
jgi:hypothetical protein